MILGLILYVMIALVYGVYTEYQYNKIGLDKGTTGERVAFIFASAILMPLFICFDIWEKK